MGKMRTQSLANKNNGIFKLKGVVEKLQKSLLQAKKWAPRNTNLGTVPEDVKEGHFAVIAAEDDEEQRFVVPLAYLGRPSFQRLLERAAEEYGFGHEGALTVPCRPSELEWILEGAGDDIGWSSCKTMVETW
ncbi:hypothetical protein L2E82_05252 [Cichorium intybus]|uniref:Uncharacterized protein n=1 Tax=Cichorium intybus TaxID=13427 RepID=A0ACB9H6X4_CICIN|nr:hypothetical protein L2E82_05252 [Cichorium intybus]